MSYIDDCNRIYTAEYNKEYSAQLLKKRKLEKNRKKDARKKALDETYIQVMILYSSDISAGTLDVKDIWNAISVVHKRFAADLSSLGVPSAIHDEVIARVEASRQSWVRTSGLGFERIIANTINASSKIAALGVKLITPSELKKMLDDKQLSNDPDDLSWVGALDESFDLYIIQTAFGKTFVVGCLQAKTSIRDRVGRDQPFSQQAMTHHFWSAAVTLDGDFLKNPLFSNMVNGKAGTQYPENGWHGMYAMARVTANNRIYAVNNSFDLLIDHVEEAVTKRMANAATFDHSWKAK